MMDDSDDAPGTARCASAFKGVGLVPGMESLRKQCLDMCCEAGRLTGARHFTYQELPDAVAAVVLEFDDGSWIIAVDAEDDTVDIAVFDPGKSPDLVVSTAPADTPWSSAIGARPRWVWILENQQGYADGVQLEFAVEGRESVTIQLMAAASTWHMGILRSVTSQHPD